MTSDREPFGSIRVDEIGELRELGIRIMGSDDLSFPAEVLASWLSANPEIIQAVRANGRIAGYIVILPLADETIDQVVRGQLRPRKIPPDAILPFAPGERSLYVAEMLIDQGLAQRSMGAAVLVRQCMRFFGEKRRLGFHPGGLWCIGFSPTGIEFARRLGCREVHVEGVSCSEWVVMKLSPGDASPLFRGPDRQPPGEAAQE
ncbi:MAG TPA: hypothetical protein VK698_23355 [Kofleriaceae bacterium]|nr:hypothetical protein [Kofleriaceae bacterium]